MQFALFSSINKMPFIMYFVSLFVLIFFGSDVKIHSCLDHIHAEIARGVLLLSDLPFSNQNCFCEFKPRVHKGHFKVINQII